MNGGRHRGPMDIDGCLTSLWHSFLVGAGFMTIVVSLMWVFSKPEDVCVAYQTTQVIEKNQAKQEILVDKQVCTQYAPSPLDSPFIRLIHWASS